MTTSTAIAAADEAVGQMTERAVERGSTLGADRAPLQSRWVLEPMTGRIVLRFFRHSAANTTPSPITRDA